MGKLIISQDGQQLHFMPESAPCYFSISPVETEDGKKTLYSVGINNVSFGIYARKNAAEVALLGLGDFVMNKSRKHTLPKDRG